jgi:hypothetical protein
VKGDPFKERAGRVTGHSVQGGRAGYEEPVLRFCFDARIASAYGLRDSRVETDKGKKPGKGAESTNKLDTFPKTRFKTERRRR